MKTPLWLCAALAVSLLGSACSRPPPPEDPIRSVKLVQAVVGGVGVRQEYAAEVRARTESRLGFRVGGKLQQRPVDVGQAVRSGQLLAVLDPQDYELGVRAATAQLGAAQTQRDLAAAELKRFLGLRDQGFVSAAEIERRQATLQGAEAALAQARSQLDVQRNQAGYTRLLADANGVVVGVEAEPGQVLAPGSVVVRLAHDGPRDAVLAVPEDRLAQVRLGMPAQVLMWAGASVASAPPFAGRVREIAASADPYTRTYAVKVALEDRSAPAPLGATATVRLGGEASATGTQAIRLPTGALWQQGQGSAVWVFDAANGTVAARTVQVAGLDGNEALIVSGLQPGEEVVSAGVHMLTQGQRVVRYTAGAAAPEAAR